MFNLSLDLNQHLDLEETFKNSPFSHNTLCQSHRRNSVVVKSGSVRPLFPSTAFQCSAAFMLTSKQF